MFRANDIFVSYSRKDITFVEKLVTAFIKEGRDVWIDWEDIPPTAEWQAEIRKGIEEADNFVIIISPDSMSSEVILDIEIAHAVEHNKRIVPILYREPDKTQQIPDVVSSHNWIFFRDEVEDFDKAFASLMQSLNTDLDHVQAHTRLTTQAVRWENHNRETSFLLTGKELDWAENWVSQAANKEPAITPLQSEYIHASRMREDYRQRIMLVGVSIAMVIALALAVLSGILFRRAEQNRQLAVAKSQTVESLELASNAQLALNSMSDTDLAIALALKSIAHVEVPPDQAQLALAEAAYAPGTRYNLVGHQAAITAVATHPDQPIGVSADASGTMIVWDFATGEEITRFSNDLPIHELNFTEDGILQALMMGRAGVNFEHFNLEENSSTQIIFLPSHNMPYRMGTFSQDVIALAAPDGSVIILQNGERVHTIETEQYAHPLTLALSPNGSQLAIGFEDNRVTLWDTESGEQLRKMDNVNVTPIDLAFHPTRNLLLAGTDIGNTLVIWNTQNGTLLDRFFGHSDTILNVAFTPDGRMAVSGSQDGTVRLWDIETGLQIRELVGHDTAVFAVEHGTNDDYVFSGAADGSVRLWDAHNGATLRHFIRHESKIHAIDYSPDGETILSGDRNADLFLWGIDETEPLQNMKGHEDVIWEIAYNPQNTSEALSASTDGTVRVWDLETGEAKLVFEEHAAPVWSAAYSPDGETIVSGDQNGVILVWEAATGEITHTIEDGHDGQRVRAIAYSPDGTTFVTGGADQMLAQWNAETFELVKRFEGHKDWVWSISFSPDGTQLISSASEQSFYLWDVATGEIIRTFDGHSGPVYDVEFSPNGDIVLSAAADSTIRLWDAETAREIRRYLEHNRGVWEIAFSPDGELFISGSGDHGVAQWEVVISMEDLIWWTLNNRFIRDLTCVERRIFDVEPLCEIDA